MELEEPDTNDQGDDGSSLDHKGRRSQARTISKRQEIEAVATRLFAERGYEGVSMRDISREAGVQLGSLSYLYPDKSAIYYAVVDKAAWYFGLPLIEAMKEEEDARRRIHTFITKFIELHCHRSNYGRILGREMTDAAIDHVPVMIGHEVSKQLRAQLDPAIALISKRGRSKEAISLRSGQIINMAYGAARTRELYLLSDAGAELDDTEYAQDVADMILHGLVNI